MTILFMLLRTCMEEYCYGCVWCSNASEQRWASVQHLFTISGISKTRFKLCTRSSTCAKRLAGDNSKKLSFLTYFWCLCGRVWRFFV